MPAARRELVSPRSERPGRSEGAGFTSGGAIQQVGGGVPRGGASVRRSGGSDPGKMRESARGWVGFAEVLGRLLRGAGKLRRGAGEGALLAGREDARAAVNPARWIAGTPRAGVRG